jgi:hypothetical protein
VLDEVMVFGYVACWVEIVGSSFGDGMAETFKTEHSSLVVRS